MFPTPELVYTDIYMVVVPYFLTKILCVQARTLRRQKKLRDPNSTMSSVRKAHPTLPPDAPPLPPLIANTHVTNAVVLATSNSSSGPNGTHCFVVVVFLAHIVIVAMRINGHINSNRHNFSSFNDADLSYTMLVDCCMLYCRECGPIAAV